MKTIFFRNTAPVIPTGAKRSGGISRLTHNATIKAGAHVSRFLGKLGMTVLLLSPVLLSAQNGVTVSNLNVDAGTVTFDVSWKTPMPVELWSDTVWVFVDYNDNGTMKRLPLTGATLINPSLATATATVPLPNDQGAWVEGNARSAGSFSATVALYYNSATAVTGACVYASNYPPVAEYREGKIFFTGTPNYKIVFEGTGGTFEGVSDGTYTIVDGETVKSFTDKTGAPGTITCVPSAMYDLEASFAGFCPGGSVTFALSNAASGRVYRLYKGGEAVDALTTGQDAAATFTGTFAGAGIYTARVDADGTHCAAVMRGKHPITANATPTQPTITLSSGNVCYNAGALVFTASSYTGALEWTEYGTGATAANSVTFAIGATTGTKTVKARSSQTYTNAPACHSAEVTQTGTINDLPTVTSFTGASRCGSGTVPLQATASSDAAIEWYEVSTEGTILLTGNEYTPDVTATKTYYAQAKHSTTGCVSALPRTEVVATVISNPVIMTQPAADTSVCPSSTVTLTVAASPATAYQWRKNGENVTGGTTATYPIAAVTANATYSVVVGNAGACSTTSDNAMVSIKTTGCYDQIDPSGCNSWVTATYVSNVMSEGTMNWADANTFCKNKEGSDWRLPNEYELQCMCSKKENIIYGFTDGSYWSESQSYGYAHFILSFTDCSYTDFGYDTQLHEVKCVK